MMYGRAFRSCIVNYELLYFLCNGSCTYHVNIWQLVDLVVCNISLYKYLM